MPIFEKRCYQATHLSLWILSLSIFTSLTLSALSHILIFIPSLYFAYKFFKEKPFKLPLSFIALLGFSLTIVASVLVNIDIIKRPVWNISKVKYQLLAITSVFAYYYTFKNYITTKQKKYLLYTFFITTSIATITGIIGLYTGYTPLRFQEACHPTRACGMYGMYMTYGYGISLFLMIVFGFYVRRAKELAGLKLNSTFLVVIFLINFAGLVLSYSRGAWISLLIAIPFFFFRENKRRFAVATLSGFILLGSALAFSSKIHNVFTKRTTSNLQRLSFFEAALHAFNEKPILGLGHRNFEDHVASIKKKYKISYPNFASHAHNNYLEVLATTGIIGAFFFLFFCLSWIFEVYSSSTFAFPFVLNFLISGTVQYTYGDGENLFLIMNFWALTILYPIMNKEIQKKKQIKEKRQRKKPMIAPEVAA